MPSVAIDGEDAAASAHPQITWQEGLEVSTGRVPV